MVRLLKPKTPSLYKRSAEITDYKEAKEIVKQLQWLIDNIPWGTPAGMAAPQIGVNKRVFIAQSKVYVNPKITHYCGDKVKSFEGCYSLAQFDYRSVVRYDRITVEYRDLKGKFQKEHLTGFAARVVQHEFDHLEGIVIDKKGDR